MVVANGNKSRSLGRIRDIEVFVEGEKTTITMEVIESKDRILILGMD